MTSNSRVPAVHKEKILPEFFKAVADGFKSFEIRKEDDTRYEVNDILILQEFDGEKLTGAEVQVEISYVTRDPRYVKEGHAVMSIVQYPHFAQTKKREMG